MIIFECLNCKIEFKSYLLRGQPRKYCSKECLSEHSHSFSICKGCNQTFRHRICVKREYCSHVCSNRVSQKARALRSEKQNFVCQICNKIITVLSCKIRGKSSDYIIKYCSRECFYKSKERLEKCAFCKNDFSPKKTKKLFCSLNCKYEWRKEKNKENPGSWLENGYKVIYTLEGKGIKEHIKIIQEIIGRKIKKNE